MLANQWTATHVDFDKDDVVVVEFMLLPTPHIV